MRSLTRLALGMGLVAVAAGPAGAQTRDGFFIGFGGGLGWAKVDCDDVDICGGPSDRQRSFTAHVRLGTTLSERLLVGAEMNGWFDSEEGNSVSLFNVTGAFYLYPTDSGLFLKGGAGLSRADFDVDVDTVSGLGWGVMAGIGYDIPVGSSTAVTPVATFWYGKPGDLEFEGNPVLPGFKHNVVEIGVGVTFY